MAAGDDAYEVEAGRELQEQGGGEQLGLPGRGVGRAGGVREEPAVQAGGHRGEPGVVEDPLAEGAEQRGDRADRGQAVALHVPDEGAHSVRPGPYVVQVAADERPALGGAVQAGAAHGAHPLGHRRQDGHLGGLGDGADVDELGVASSPHPGDDHAEQADRGHGRQVGAAGVGAGDGRHGERRERGAGADGGAGGAVREGGHGGQPGEEEADLCCRGEALGEHEHDQGDRGGDAGPARRGCPAQPARLLASASHPSTLVRARWLRTPDGAAGGPVRARSVSGPGRCAG